MNSTVEAQEFWHDTLGDNPTPEQIAAELHDYWLTIQRVPKVYHELTAGRFTKPNTEPVYILDCVEEATQRAVAEETARCGKMGAAYPALAVDYANLADSNQKLRKALAFARSVIQCGEPWTATCERVINGALEMQP